MTNPNTAIDGKILVIRGGALGDFILTLPVLAALRLRFPKHRLEILGYPAVASLAVAGGLADEVVALESPRFTGFFVANGNGCGRDDRAPQKVANDWGSWSSEVADWFSGFDCIISYLYDPEEIFRSNVARCSSARFIAGSHRPDETLGVHATELLLRPLEALGIFGADAQPRLSLAAGELCRKPLSPALSSFAGREGGRLALHPGSGSDRKNWPEDKWAELLKLVVAQSACDLLLVGGEAEGDRCARLAAVLPTGRVQVAQNLPLIELARCMQTCSAFIGHDSGVTHLAAALGLPGLVLWGETVLAIWRPQSDRMRILRDPGGLKGLPVAVVWEELRLVLPAENAE